MAVVDSSVWLDLFLENEQRAKRAETILEHVKSIYEPKVFKVWKSLAHLLGDSKKKIFLSF